MIRFPPKHKVTYRVQCLGEARGLQKTRRSKEQQKLEDLTSVFNSYIHEQKKGYSSVLPGCHINRQKLRHLENADTQHFEPNLSRYDKSCYRV